MTPLLLKPTWPAPSNVQAVSSTRFGGYSQGVFQGLNLGLHVGDDAATVARNRSLFQQQAAMPVEPCWLDQVHSNKVWHLTESTAVLNAALPQADAAFSQQAGQVCVVMTADCLPLLVCNNAGSEVAAIHAGWRGLASGVIEHTLQQFQAKPSELLVWLGPAIGPKHFEVGAEVRQAFVQQNVLAASAFKPLGKEKYLADLYLLARLRLQAYGVSAIFGGNYCTYHDTAQFYSYRRDGQTGRMASAIWLSRSS
ncbi:peptidoglycan editing factor PgeF [Alishewanella sp. HL-SH06]|uniref:peptidoglycan editing factor PgeF n=1 Tax=Alishewanella sp. HL-SH06 TaxID=3461144 RepID=UPI0040423AEA